MRGSKRVGRRFWHWAIALMEEALKRSQTEEDGEISRWLLQMFHEQPQNAGQEREGQD